MTLQVVGTGFGRTGTLSLKAALEMLGFGPCHHMLELRVNEGQLPFWQAAERGEMPDWDEVFAEYGAAVDWPSARYWREIAAHFADAKVLLSVRPAEDWFRSIHATIYPRMSSHADEPPGLARDRMKMAYEIIVNQTFDGRIEDKAHACAVFEAHIKEVQATIAPERLLTFDVKEGWAPLCAHLGVPVPEEPFPRRNTTEEFQRSARERAKSA